MTNDRKSEIRESYRFLGNIGSLYDKVLTYSSPLGKLFNTMMWGFNEESTEAWITNALSGIPEDFSGKLLEVPVGTGVLTMPLYKSLVDANITCLDYSKQMLENAKNRAEKMNIHHVQFMQGDVGQLPFEDESFDIVLSLNGFHAFPDKEAAYKETYRVLKKGGIFCGCFYIKGQAKRTDWFVKHLLVPKGAFTPPFESKNTLNERLSKMYSAASLESVRAIGTFQCVK